LALSMPQAMARSTSKRVITTSTSYSPRGKSCSESRSICTVNRSPTADTGSPSADISIPEASIDTCPAGLANTSKMVPGDAQIAR